MAILQPGALAAEVRGKLGDTVYLRTIGGPAVRSLGTWIQPDTPLQEECRAAIRALSKAWSDTLEDVHRAAWHAYAQTNPRPNRWGQLTNTSGYLCFVRHNAHSYRDTEALQFPFAPSAPAIHPPSLEITVQQDGAIVIGGDLEPDVTGTYVPDAEKDGHPRWTCTTPAGVWWIIWITGAYYISDSPIFPTGERWYASPGLPGPWLPGNGATGEASGAWTYDASLARLTTPPINYPDPPADLTLYLQSGKPITIGRRFYARPWARLATISPPTAASSVLSWLRWTWPEHATPPPYEWNPAGSDVARMRATAQDAASGAMSTAHITTPIFESLDPW